MINWGRFFVSVLIATVICFMSDGMLHELVIKQQWSDLFANLNNFKPTEQGGSLLYFAIFEFGRAVIAMAFYVLFEKRGMNSAAIAGLLSWFAFSLTGPVQMLPLSLFSHALWVRMAGFQLVTSVLASMAAAAAYPKVSQ